MLSLLIRRELRASLRSPHTLLQPVLFFTLTICLFPLASGADNEALARIAPAALWIALLLAALPLLALMLHIPATKLPAMAALLALGSLPLLLVGTLGAVLTLAQSHSTFLRFLIVVPLYIPVLIIGVTASHDSLLGLAINGHYALLGAFNLFALITIIPFGTLAIRAQGLP